MWWRRGRVSDARNVLFDAALEFGPNWRRAVIELAGERLVDLGERERVAVADEIEAARGAIEDWIMDRWNASGGRWSTMDAGAARDFIRSAYPWMDDRNVEHAISQGTYYAWHG